MRFRAVASGIASGFLMALVQFVATLPGAWEASAGAVVLGLVSPEVFGFLGLEAPFWAPGATATLSSLVGILPRWVAGPDSWLVAAPVAALGAAGLRLAIGRLRSQRCALCNRRLTGVHFTCPRCGLLVCEQLCWDFDHCRCRLCEQNHVPIFGPDGRWWDKQLGPKVSYGRCQLCLATAEAADLRACPQCGRPQCRTCWDSENGQCNRCRWVLPDLPPQLRAYLMPAPR